MKKNIFLKQTFLLEDTTEDGQLSGKFSGIANSGKSVGYHSGFDDLITDIEGLTFKDQIPVFMNHWHENIVGFASLKKEDGKLLIDGKISQATQYGKDVLNLAKDGFLWELSIGVSSDNYERLKEVTTVNGFEANPGSTIIRDGHIFEVSFVPIGADSETVVQIFNKQKEGVNKMKVEFDKDKWEKFACGCGGSADSSLDDISKKLEVDQEEADALKAENEALKAEIAALKEKIAADEEEEMKKEVKEIADKKGIKLSDDKLKELTSDTTKAKMFIEMASSMEDKKTIDPKFVKNVVIGQESIVLSAVDKSKARRAKAQELIDSKQAKDMVEAIAMLPDEDYK